jgi:hypothetical protein
MLAILQCLLTITNNLAQKEEMQIESTESTQRRDATSAAPAPSVAVPSQR